MRMAVIGVVCIALSLAALSAFASQADAHSALVHALTARVTVAQGESLHEIVGERVVREGNRIRTDTSGQALITYRDGSTVLLDVESELVIEAIEMDERGLLVRMTQTLGRAWYSLSRLAVDSRFEVHSAAMASVIRAGSNSYVVVGPDGETQVVVTEGTVETAGAGVTVTVAAGSSTSIAVGSTPSSPVPVPAAPQPTPAPTTTPAPNTPPTATPAASPSPTPAATPVAVPPLWPSPTAAPRPIPSTAISPPPAPLTSVAPVVSPPATARPLPAFTAEPTPTIAPLPTAQPTSPTLR
jgi:hypothetical protein